MFKNQTALDAKPSFDDVDLSFSDLSQVGELDDLESLPTVINYSESIFGYQ